MRETFIQLFKRTDCDGKPLRGAACLDFKNKLFKPEILQPSIRSLPCLNCSLLSESLHETFQNDELSEKTCLCMFRHDGRVLLLHEGLPGLNSVEKSGKSELPFFKYSFEIFRHNGKQLCIPAESSDNGQPVSGTVRDVPAESLDTKTISLRQLQRNVF